MNKNLISMLIDSLDLDYFIFNLYSSILIGLLFFPPVFWLFIGLESLLS
jgi:hypothetical protein